MRRRRIPLLSCLLIAAVLLFLASAARAEIAQAMSSAEQRQWTASMSHPSSSLPQPRPSSSSPNSRRRSLKCDSSMVSVSASGINSSASSRANNGSGGGGNLFRSLNSTSSGGSVVNDACSQAKPVVDANATAPLDNKVVLHARQWTEDEIVETAMRRRGARVRAGALTEFDLAAASPLLLPSLIRFRPLSDSQFGDEAARVMAVFSDGEVPADSTINGLPRSVARLEAVVSSLSSSSGGGAKVRRTISPRGLRTLLSRPELVLLAMAAANRTLAPGVANAAATLRITKDEYRAFLTRDSHVHVCDDLPLVGDVGAPVDRLFAIADANGDGTLDASEIRRHNLTDAGTVWILAGDTNGDGMLSAEELADGLPGFGDLQPRGGTQGASPEQIRRIRETTALAAVAAYDVEEDGRLTPEEMRVYSSDFTRRSMGQTLVPIWAFSWHVAQIAVNDTRESSYLEKNQELSQLTEWKGAEAAKAAAEQREREEKKNANTKKPAEAFPSLLTPQHRNASASSNSTSSRFSIPSSFDGSAALRSFMLSHANFSMTARASLAAASAAGMSYASGNIADLAPAFDVWSRGASPEVTQKEWIDFYAAVHRTGARAYWTIGQRAGPGAVAPECCGARVFSVLFCFWLLSRRLSLTRLQNSLFLFFLLFFSNTTREKKTGVLSPGLVEIAKVLPPQWGAAPILLPIGRAEADAVRFDSDGDGDGVEGSELSLLPQGSGSNSSSNGNATAAGHAEAALTHVDILEWGILRLGTLCDALPPVKAMGN